MGKLRDSRRNWKDYDGSFEKKAAKTVTNNLRKVVTLSECCGSHHHGEPGC